jgi:hypothetical protein
VCVCVCVCMDHVKTLGAYLSVCIYERLYIV